MSLVACSILLNKDYLLLTCIYFHDVSIFCAQFILLRLATSLGGLLGEASSEGLPKIRYYYFPGQGISGLLRFGVLPLPFCSFLL